VLLVALFVFLAYLFAQSAFIAHLRGNSVELAPDQFPELYQQYLEACTKLGVQRPPTAYLMMSDGVLNALAARFLRRYYVVVYSSIIDALKSRPEAVRFYFGHELAHVLRGHLSMQWLRLPASVLPLLGTAYRRAQEYTCDLHGLAAAASTADSVAALTVLATGGEKLPQVNVQRFVAQQQASGGFWMSYHELTADYPWLCKRVSNVLRASGSNEAALVPPRRSFWAGVLALFTPRIGAAGGGASVLIAIAIIGILAAIAIPAYQDYSVRAQLAPAFTLVDQVVAAAAPYVEENSSYPDVPSEVGLPESLESGPVSGIEITEEGFVLALRGDSAQIDGHTVIVAPTATTMAGSAGIARGERCQPSTVRCTAGLRPLAKLDG
jgi:Tfp pilus assembly protein PilE/Zn-dependent protease with chaperone function